MADHHVQHFHNGKGVHAIDIGVRRFKCIGAPAPYDHPHIFLEMGAQQDNQIVCPYCSTLYRYRSDLAANETAPPDCLAIES